MIHSSLQANNIQIPGTCSTYSYTLRGTVFGIPLGTGSKTFNIRVVADKEDRLRRVMMTYPEIRVVKQQGCRISYWGILLFGLVACFWFFIRAGY